MLSAEQSQTHLNDGEEDNFVEAADKTKKKATCADYLKRFDQLIMRPILIHKYEKDSTARAKEFYEMFQEDGQKIEKLFREQQKSHPKVTTSEVGKGGTGSDKKSDMLRAATTLYTRRQSVRKVSSDLHFNGSNQDSNKGSARLSARKSVIPTTSISEDQREEDTDQI